MDGMEKLEREGFVRLPWRKSLVAVYCLLEEGEVVYVGQTKSLYNRLTQHYWAIERRSRKVRFPNLDYETFEFDEVWFRWTTMREIDRLEREFIHRFKPKHNRQMYTELPKAPIDIVALALRAGVSLRERRRIGE